MQISFSYIYIYALISKSRSIGFALTTKFSPRHNHVFPQIFMMMKSMNVDGKSIVRYFSNT